MWVIVNFTLENAVEVVPQQWIHGNQCYWPPYRGPKLKSAIADKYKVGDDWDLHPIRILNKNKIYDDLVKARNACERAQFTSDCSENEAKRVIKRKVLSSSSSSSEDEFQQKLPQVPEGFSEKDMNRKSKMKSQVEKKNNLSGSSHISIPQNSEEPRNKEFEFQVLRKLSTLTLKIQQIGEDLASIRETLLEKNLDLPTVAEEEFLYQFPTDSLTSFENLDRIFENKREYEKFVVYLGKIGGNTVYDCVKRIHSRILSDEVASEYNWHGLKGKKIFKHSFLAKATIEAILKNKHIVTSEKNIEEAVKSWLRHAKDRLLRKGLAEPEQNIQ